jgi:hypothetical protein
MARGEYRQGKNERYDLKMGETAATGIFAVSPVG